MDDTKPIVLLTRPDAQARAFLEYCEAELETRISALISPVLTIVPLAETPDLDSYKTLVFTSANGVHQIGEGLAGRNVVAVGRKTTELAASFGADARMLGENAAGLLSNSAQIQGPALVCRGKHASADICAALQTKGIRCEDAVLYDQVEKLLSSEAQTVLMGNRTVILPIFSPRSARLLSGYEMSENVVVLAISQETANAWSGPGKVRIARAPDARSICLALRGLI